MKSLHLLFCVMVLSAGYQVAAQTAEDIAAEKAMLAEYHSDDFALEMSGILYDWADEARDYWGYDSDRTDRAAMLVEAIDNHVERTAADPETLHPVTRAVQMVALRISGAETASGKRFDRQEALDIYRNGIVSFQGGPPMDLRGEYQTILRAIWQYDNDRQNLDGLNGEEAPGAYELMLFGETDIPTLCEPGEAVFWSCPDETRDRYLSVCGSPSADADTAWVQYRIGTPDALELAYPENKMSGKDLFDLSVYRGGAELSFTNGAYKYLIQVDQFTDMSDVDVTRDGERVFALSCPANYSDIGSVEGHLGATPNPDRLTVLPKPMSASVETACADTQAVLMSCHNVEDAFTASVCTQSSPSGTLFSLRMKRGEEAAYTAYPEDGDVTLESTDLRIEVDETGSLFAFNEHGHQEYFLTADPSDVGTGNFTYWRGGTPRSNQDCTVSHLDEGGIEAFALGLDAPPLRTYAPVPVSAGRIGPSPAEFDDLINTIKTLEANGEFKSGAGMTPRDDLGGLSAKAFIMSRKADDFRCEADFGGMCGGSDVEALWDEMSFIFGFFDPDEWQARDGFRDMSFDLASEDEIDLTPLAFRFSQLNPAGTPILFDEDGFCQARADYDWETYTESVTAFQETFGFTETEQYEALWNSLRGVMSRYNVRAEPSLDADIVGSIENEMIYLPVLGEVIENDGHGWRFVNLPDGTVGFAAIKDEDLLKLGNGDVGCGRIEDGVAKLTSVSFGGD